MSKRSEWQKELILRGKEDPVWWIQTVLGDTLWGKQQEIAMSLVSTERVAVPASFGVGKTFLAARIALWWLYTHYPSKVISTAPTGRQVKDLLWAELRTAHAKAKVPLGGSPLTLGLQLSPEHFAVGFSTDDTNMDMFTGYHSPHMLVLFDQAGGIPPNVYKAAEGLMTSKKCRWLAISNTAISEGAFADICMPDRDSPHGDWKIIPISAEESPNVKAGKNLFPGIISCEWLEQKKRVWDPDDPLYKIFVKAEFVPASQMSLVPYVDFMTAIKNEGELDLEEGIDIGLDVARSGTDSTVWIARSGTKALAIQRMTGNDTMRTVNETQQFKVRMQEIYNLPIRFIKVDVIGVGAGVFDRLNELDEPVVAVNNAETAVDTERFGNTRAEMAWAFRERCISKNVGLGYMLENERELGTLLRQDAQSMKYKITPQGKILLWSKDDLKKELGRSPDYWDALVMAFEDPKGGVPRIEFVSSAKMSEDENLTADQWNMLFGNVLDLDEEFDAAEITLEY